jgi:hypothetical protein
VGRVGVCTLIESDAVETSGRGEGGTRPGRTWKKPKDLTACDSEEGRCGEGCLRKWRVVYFQQYKKRAKAKGNKKCHTETMRGKKSRYNLYIREPLIVERVFFYFCFS